ncbi:MAG TPA: glycoside hydrolase family 15 protein [Acidimicrobiia bacterium]|jgi:GH15 family glucan-1,4-alpha-glucosidase
MTAIEQYALVGDTQTAALIADDGSVDWLCVPRFDSGACFAALLGDESHGHWQLAPAAGGRATRRAYRDGTLVLETEWDTPEGTVRIVDCMPVRDQSIDLVRVVEGVSGRVPMRMDFIVRFDYGSIVPWVHSQEGTLRIIAGPAALCLTTPVRLKGHDYRHTAEFTVEAGDRVPFVLAGYPSFEDPPPRVDAFEAIERTTAYWQEWSARSTYDGDWRDVVQRSLITLKALTYEPTGGIVAAPTTSLPERIGGVRNWDYRYCWLRDATFTIYSLMTAGYTEEACSFRDWLLRAVAGDPGHLQIMYGPAGERRLSEYEVDWLPGYEGSTPVRVGNAAHHQYQLDVYGEVVDSMHQSRHMGIEEVPNGWAVQRALLDYLESGWREPDEGIWEVRGGRKDFVHSKVMAWVAFDRAVKGVEEFGLDGPVDQWRTCCETIHDEVCERGFDAERNAFVQYYGSKDLDASALMIPLVGFLPPTDPRIAGTVDAIERELMTDGFVRRYQSEEGIDGLPPGEGVFLPCSFWLADNLALLGRHDEGRALFERLIALRNDVGLLSEEYDPSSGRMLGNFPQAFTHVSLVNTASNLSSITRPALHRSTGEDGLDALDALNATNE